MPAHFASSIGHKAVTYDRKFGQSTTAKRGAALPKSMVFPYMPAIATFNRVKKW
jgi:hypothetical protein